MAIIPFLFSNGHGQMVKINRYFDNINKFQPQNIWDCRYSHDQIGIDHFDRENFALLKKVIIEFGLTILTIEPQFGQMVKKSWSSDPLTSYKDHEW